MPGSPTSRNPQVVETISNSSRVIVKLGTAIVTREDGQPALGRLAMLAEQIREIKQQGRQVVLVSSGAFGIGALRLGFEGYPRRRAERQICAAVGQVALMALYDHLFGCLGLQVGQILLTQEDFTNPEALKKLTMTIEQVLAAKVVPIVNENDAVSAEDEQEVVFKDNDKLSALLATAIEADLLMMLSNIPGVLTAPPDKPNVKRISVYDDNVEIEMGKGSKAGRGGLSAKIEAAQYAADQGVMTVVVDGSPPNILSDVLEGKDVGTMFMPKGL